MGNKEDMPARGTAEQYRKEIVDIVDKIEDEKALRSIYITAKTYLSMISEKEGD